MGYLLFVSGMVAVFSLYALVGFYFALVGVFRCLGCSCWVLVFRGCMGLIGACMGVWCFLVSFSVS